MQAIEKERMNNLSISVLNSKHNINQSFQATGDDTLINTMMLIDSSNTTDDEEKSAPKRLMTN